MNEWVSECKCVCVFWMAFWTKDVKFTGGWAKTLHTISEKGVKWSYCLGKGVLTNHKCDKHGSSTMFKKLVFEGTQKCQYAMVINDFDKLQQWKNWTSSK